MSTSNQGSLTMKKRWGWPSGAMGPTRTTPPMSTGLCMRTVHWGRGKVSVYERTVFLEPDFEVGPGPQYHVYLVPNAGVRKEDQVAGSMFVDLGRLRSFKGSQRYPIPAGVDLKKYPSVVIWCEAFGVLISPADLKAVN